MTYVNDRDVAHLGPSCCRTSRRSAATRRYRRRVRRRQRPGLSSPRHRRQRHPRDRIVLLAGTLRSRGVDVHALATPLITHAEVDRAAAATSARWTLLVDVLGGRASRIDGASGMVRLGCGPDAATALLAAPRLSRRRQRAELARPQTIVGDRTDPDAPQPHDRMPDRVAHLPHLAVAPFVDDERQDALWRRLISYHAAEQTSASAVRRPSTVTPRASRSSACSSGTPRTRTSVLARDPVTRMGQTRGEIAVARQDAAGPRSRSRAGRPDRCTRGRRPSRADRSPSGDAADRSGS